MQPGRGLIKSKRSLTEFEVPMKDVFIMEVFEARDDLSEVVPHFRVSQSMPRLPDVCQWLQQTTAEQNEVSEVRARWYQMSDGFTDVLYGAGWCSLPFCCRARGRCRCCPGPQNDVRTWPRACAGGSCAARFRSWSERERRGRGEVRIRDFQWVVGYNLRVKSERSIHLGHNWNEWII